MHQYYTVDGMKKVRAAQPFRLAIKATEAKTHFHACIFCQESFVCHVEACAIEARYAVCSHVACVEAWEVPAVEVD